MMKRTKRRSGAFLLVTVLSAVAASGPGFGGAVQAEATAAPTRPSYPAQASPDDDFYVPPDPLPEGSPGDVVRSRPSTAGPPSTRALADAWQVMYLSTNGIGETGTVTGTILVPKGADPGTVPIIGFGPGTHGPAAHCAPSLMIDSGAFYEQPAVDDMLRRGYAVAVTDY